MSWFLPWLPWSRDPQLRPIVLALDRHQNMKMLIAGGPRTLFEDQEDDLAALPSPAVPEYGPQHLRAKVVQTAFRVLFGDAHAVS